MAERMMPAQPSTRPDAVIGCDFGSQSLKVVLLSLDGQLLGEAGAAYDVDYPRPAWAEYLCWYRHFLAIPVRYGTRLVRIEPAEGHFRPHLEGEAGAMVETARKIILANGVAGNGGPYIPPVVSDGLPRHRYAHTADTIDFAATMPLNSSTTWRSPSPRPDELR